MEVEGLSNDNQNLSDDVLLEELRGEEGDRPMGAAEPIEEGITTMGLVGVPAEDVPLPEQLNLPPNDEVINLLVGQQFIRNFWKRLEAAQQAVNEQINDIQLANLILEKLQQARNYLLAGKENIEEADRLLSEVEHRIAFTQRVRLATRKFAPWLLLYEILWLVGMGVGIFRVSIFSALYQFEVSPAMGSIELTHLVNALFWGGMGGVVGALYALWKHTADKQDFDSQYWMWYITNPILGVGLGAFTFLVFQAGFFSLTAGGDIDSIQSPSVIYLFAWITGFKQNVVYEIVRRILDVFRVESKSEAEELPVINIEELPNKSG